MTVWRSLRHLLPALAMLGLLLSPIFASAMGGSGGMPEMLSSSMMTCDSGVRESSHHHMTTEQMQCSSPDQPVSTDCGTACPMVTLCFGKIFENMPAGNIAPHALDIAQILIPGNGLFPDTLAQAPPLQPPQA